ncbi:hypothetical protein IWZ01DRAFT_367584 [Phyllosticta capitalensis]
MSAHNQPPGMHHFPNQQQQSSAGNMPAPHDVLLQCAQQRLPPFLSEIVWKYTRSAVGLDGTEYPLLVSALATLIGSSPTEDQLFAAQSLHFFKISFTPNSAELGSIWQNPPINLWFEWAVQGISLRPPPRMYSPQYRNEVHRRLDVELENDAAALVHKVKRYLTTAPGILERFCESGGLEAFKLKTNLGEHPSREQGTDDHVPQENQGQHAHQHRKTELSSRERPGQEPEWHRGARGKRQLEDIVLEEGSAKRFRGQEEERDNAGQQDKFSSSSTITAYSAKIHEHCTHRPSQKSRQKEDTSGFDAVLAAAEIRPSNNFQDKQTGGAPKPAQYSCQEELSGLDALVAAANVLASDDTTVDRVQDGAQQPSGGVTGEHIRGTSSLTTDKLREMEREEDAKPDLKRQDIETWMAHTNNMTYHDIDQFDTTRQPQA